MLLLLPACPEPAEAREPFRFKVRLVVHNEARASERCWKRGVLRLSEDVAFPLIVTRFRQL